MSKADDVLSFFAPLLCVELYEHYVTIGLLLATLPEPLGPVITRSDVSFKLFIQI